eukprot:CAMPEP_0180394092 /NCGR_PEP_ID=MMETSP0989-20121125/34101_1 /TAXON_ID=697907 /ORGANISM="non described non described, Strain CCMP2293" /LENGTH=59 /DNA_ID=CAMNT_0022396025 /DNA_START=13 /DNA_END=189 /DNA_ORIENTATION=+
MMGAAPRCPASCRAAILSSCRFALALLLVATLPQARGFSAGGAAVTPLRALAPRLSSPR